MAAEWSAWLVDWLPTIIGRSFVVDSLIGLSLRNELIKAVPVAGCLAAAWYSGTPSHRRQRRKVLLVTLVAAVLASGLSRLLSERNSLPRPYVMARTVYRYQDGRVEKQPTSARVMPLDNASVLRRTALAAGTIPDNDFGSFPSDHASLFVTLTLGILYAWPRAGLCAGLWTMTAILLPKICLGMHSPLDVAAGGVLGAVCFFVLQDATPRVSGRWLDRAATISLKREWLSSPVLFACLFEVCNTFDHVSALAHGAKRLLLG